MRLALTLTVLIVQIGVTSGDDNTVHVRHALACMVPNNCGIPRPFSFEKADVGEPRHTILANRKHQIHSRLTF